MQMTRHDSDDDSSKWHIIVILLIRAPVRLIHISKDSKDLPRARENNYPGASRLGGTFYLLVVTRYLKWKVFVLSPSEMKINVLLSKHQAGPGHQDDQDEKDGPSALIN